MVNSRLRKLACVVTFAVATTTAAALPILPAAAAPSSGVNDSTCRPSSAHPNPVVFLHGLGATHYEDINMLQADVSAQGYCTYSETYGDYPGFPLVGGLRPIADSAVEIKTFISQVLAQTGAAKVDLVGHSEGGFLTLYVTKTQGIANKIGKVVAIAPPTHGATAAGLADLVRPLGSVGCPACSDLIVGGSAIATLEKGPIAQPGVDYTIMTSRTDELVTPTQTSFVREAGVTNSYVQDVCPDSRVGHVGEPYDLSVWDMVGNALDPAHAVPVRCTPLGFPL